MIFGHRRDVAPSRDYWPMYKTSTPVFWHGRISKHADPTSARRAILIGTRLRKLFHPKLYIRVGGRFVRFWASGGTKFPKMGDSLPRTPMNHRANLTPLALSSPEKSVTVQTKKQKVGQTDISTLCLPACVDNKHGDCVKFCSLATLCPLQRIV